MDGLKRWFAHRRRQKLLADVSADGSAKRVARGAEYLDAVDPAWYYRIDAETLALQSPDCCILGQLHGDYRAGLFRADVLNGKSVLRGNQSPFDLGFQALGGDEEELIEMDYENLNAAWRQEISRRVDVLDQHPVPESGVPRRTEQPALT